MNITFMIGNGFDVNLGLKTRYSDFYEFYKRQNLDDMIAKSIAGDFEMWSDLELGLGSFLKDLNASQIDEFLDSKSTLEQLLAEYLSKENDLVKIESEAQLATEFCKKVVNLGNELNSEDRQQLKKIVASASEEIRYCFITFNYTNTLDIIIQITNRRKDPFSAHNARSYRYLDSLIGPLHIHGELTDDLILGLDIPEQIQNKDLAHNTALTNYIIKSSVNEALGERRTEQAKQIIDNSKFVCLFGLSFGETDGMWWDYLVSWLNQDKDNRLILFVRGDGNIRISGQEKVRYRDRVRKLFLKHSRCENEEIINNVIDRISVVLNSTIFDLENVTVETKEPSTVGGS